MKRFLYPVAALFLCALSSASLYAQPTWEKVNGPNESINTITATGAGDLFLGSNNYGAFKSTDAGVTWVQENQGLPDVLIRTLQASSTDDVFAGTGSNGIYRYSAGTWSAANNGLPSNNLLTSWFAKGNSGEMYMVTTSDNIYKWDGATWTSIKFNLPALVRTVVVASTGTVYAGCFNSGVYKFDGVNNWTTLGTMPNSFITRMVISQSDMLFVACNSNNIYRIPASGGSWTSINTGLPTTNATVMGVDAGSNLFLGYTSALYGNIYRSVNNGDAWTQVTGSLETGSFLGFAGAPNGHDYICGSGIYKSTTSGSSWLDMNPGLDARKAIKSFAAAPNGTLFVGTQVSGVWRSTDNGYTWQQKNTGISTIYTDQVMTTANGTILYSAYIPGNPSTGVLFRSTNNGNSWSQVASNGTDHYTKIKQHHSDTVWVTGRFGGPVLAFSTNNGATWTNHPINAFSAVWDIEFDAGSMILLGSESEGVSRSTDGGNSWTEGVGNSTAWYGNVIEVEFDHNGYLFAGTDWYNNILWFSPPGSNGDSWTEFLDADFNGLNDIYDLVFDVNNNAYVATGNTAYKEPIYMAYAGSWNANTSWFSASTGLPSVAPVLELGFDPAGFMYAVFFETGQEGGLYRSTTPVNTPLPIELTTFTGYHQNRNNYLTWSTASETENRVFEIEKSTDGAHFNRIGEMPGQGNVHTTHTYSYTDYGVAGTTCYYRLHQLDNNGKGTYSNIVVLTDNEPEFRITPNPAREQLRFSKDLEAFDIINVFGEIVVSNETATNHVSIAHLADGMYFIRTGQSVQKFMVKHE
jgi:hypothetical protein